MKKTSIALSILAVSSFSAAHASDAILNVEGEIQVNGKTVITSAGDFVGGGVGGGDNGLTTVVLHTYLSSDGTYEFESRPVAGSGWDEKPFTYTIVREGNNFIRYGQDGEIQFSFESLGEGRYKQVSHGSGEICDEWDANYDCVNPITYKTKSEAVYADQSVIDSETATIGLTTSYLISSVSEGGTHSIYDYSDGREDEVFEFEDGGTYIHSGLDNFGAVVDSYSVDGNTYTNCIVETSNDGYMNVACEDIGMVHNVRGGGSGHEEVLVNYSNDTSAAQSRSSATVKSIRADRAYASFLAGFKK